jgi:hypothetical protein
MLSAGGASCAEQDRSVVTNLREAAPSLAENCAIRGHPTTGGKVRLINFRGMSFA